MIVIYILLLFFFNDLRFVYDLHAFFLSYMIIYIFYMINKIL